MTQESARPRTPERELALREALKMANVILLQQNIISMNNREALDVIQAALAIPERPLNEAPAAPTCSCTGRNEDAYCDIHGAHVVDAAPASTPAEPLSAEREAGRFVPTGDAAFDALGATCQKAVDIAQELVKQRDAARAELTRLRQEILGLEATIEVLSDNEMVKGIAAGLKDVREGRTKSLEEVRRDCAKPGGSHE